jgi:enoyl-[acyl-carrier protein] reductase I
MSDAATGLLAAGLPIDLAGRTALVLGIANEASIATGCARAFARAGARLGVTYLNDKARPFVAPVAEALGAEFLIPCDLRETGALERVFAEVARRWGRLDILLHSIAFAPKEDLHAPLIESSAAGFGLAIDLSCHSFVRAARLARPLMKEGGTLLTVSFYGATRVVPHYDLMGPVKAALESAVRYLAAELGPEGIRVHALSPGPIRTRAASGLDHFDELLAQAAAKAPEHQLVSIDDVGAVAAFLASPLAARMTGTIVPIDGGQHIMA